MRLIKSGPNILITFYLNDREIEKTDIQLNSDGCAWEIFGSHSKNEKLIDDWMSTYCQKKQPTYSLPLDLGGSSFSKRALRCLCEIPFGELISYKELATRAGSPNGARAVGNACGSNQLVLIVPCHRVIASGNAIGGFGCGLKIKRELLRFEGHEKFTEK